MAQNTPLSKEDRRRLVEQQARDSRGRWIEEGKNAFSVVNGKRYPGTVLAIKNGYAYLLPPIKNPTHRPDPYRVPLKGVTMSPGKGTFERAKDVRGAAEQEAEKAGNSGAYDGMTDQEFMDQLRKHRKDYEREMKKALSSDDTEDDKEYRKEHRRVVAQGKKNPDDVAPLPSREHSDDSIQSTAKAMSEYTKTVQEAYKGDRGDFKDIGHQEFKDDKGNTFFLSPRQGKNGPEIVVRDEDKSEVFSFPANEGDSPEDLARKMLDVTDFEDGDNTPETEQPTLFDMEEDDTEAEPKPSRAKRDSQKPEEEAQPTLFDEEDDSEADDQEPADTDQNTTPETSESSSNPYEGLFDVDEDGNIHISTVNLPEAIKTAQNNDDKATWDRLTDLDQYGSGSAWDDVLAPAPGTNLRTDYNMKDWLRRNASNPEAVSALHDKLDRMEEDRNRTERGEGSVYGDKLPNFDPHSRRLRISNITNEFPKESREELNKARINKNGDDWKNAKNTRSNPHDTGVPLSSRGLLWQNPTESSSDPDATVWEFKKDTPNGTYTGKLTVIPSKNKFGRTQYADYAVFDPEGKELDTRHEAGGTSSIPDALARTIRNDVLDNSRSDETPRSSQEESTPQPEPRSQAPAARRSDEALTISEDDISGAINDAREKDDREKLDRLTDLDQYGNAPAPYKSRGDRLIPAEGESRISGHNLRAWWARNTDEGAREEAINKLESRVSRAKDEFQQLISGEEPPRLLDLNRAMSVLQRSVRDRNTLQQLNNPDWEPDDRELVSAQKAADQVREFRAEQRARNQETFNKHREVRHNRLKDYRDKLADGSKERRDIDRYLNSIDEKLKDNKGSYLGPALARELANAERHVKRQNQDSLWQEARTNHMPSEDLMDAVRIAMNNDVPAGMRLAYKYTGSMDDSDNLRYKDGRKVQVGDILYYQHQKKRIATEQDDTDGTMVVPFEDRYTKVEVVTVPTKGSGDFRILPVEGEEIYSERINKDTGEIERYNVMTREDYLARGESSNSKPYIMANTDRVADLEYRHFNRVTVDNGIGGRIQSSSGARYRLADGSMVAAGTRVKYVNTIARTRDENGNKVPVGTIMYGWIHSEVPNRNGTVSVARELADGSILQDAEGNRASEIDNDEGIKFTRQNIILRGQPSLANMLPADSEFDPPTKAQLNDGDNLLPLPEGMFRENGTGLVTAREGGEARARELQAYQWGESHLIRDEDVVEDETPVRPDMPLSETNNRAAQLTRINTATPQRTATAVESEPAPTPEPTPEPEEESTPTPEPEAEPAPAPALSPDDPRARENAFLQRSSAEAAANYFNKRFSSNPKLRGLGVTPRTYRSDFFTNDPARLRHFLDWYMKNAEANSLPIPESVRELMRQLDEYDNRLSVENKQEIRRGTQESILTTLEDKGFISISGDTVSVQDKDGALAELAKEADRIEKENRPKLNNSKSTRRDREEAHERNAAVVSIRRQIERQSRDDDGPAPDILESDGPSDADLADEEVPDVDIEDED